MTGGRPRTQRKELDMKKASKATPYLYLIPIVVLFGVLLVYPIMAVISYSFASNVIVTPKSEFVALANFAKVFGDVKFWKAFWNSVEFSLISIVFHMVLGMSFALMLNSKLINPRLRGVIRALYILPWTFTVSIVAILWRLMLNNSGIINQLIGSNTDWFGTRAYAKWAIIFVNIWCSFPFYMISILAGLQGISPSYYEAASIDGASGVKSFCHITLPQLRPVLISLSMLDFIWSMQQLSLTYITTGGGPAGSSETLGTFTYNLAFSKYKFSLASTSALMIMAVCLFVAVFYVKQQRGDHA